MDKTTDRKTKSKPVEGHILFFKRSSLYVSIEHAPTFTLFVWLISHQIAVLFSQNKSAPAISLQPNEHVLLKPSRGCPISCAREHRRLRHGQERIKGSGGRRGGDEQEMLSSPGLVD
jgi:hypothetical protein